MVVALPASAQSQLALEAGFGGDFALSPFLHNTVRVDATDNVPSLSNRFTAPGVQTGVSVLLSNTELRYTYQRYAWAREVRLCEGDRAVEQLVNGEVDDSEVRYDCDIGRTRIDVSDEDLDPLNLHHFNVGVRIPARGLEQPAIYAVISPGLTLTGFRDEVDADCGRRRLRRGVSAYVAAARRPDRLLRPRVRRANVPGARGRTGRRHAAGCDRGSRASRCARARRVETAPVRPRKPNPDNLVAYRLVDPDAVRAARRDLRQRDGDVRARHRARVREDV